MFGHLFYDDPVKSGRVLSSFLQVSTYAPGLTDFSQGHSPCKDRTGSQDSLRLMFWLLQQTI